MSNQQQFYGLPDVIVSYGQSMEDGSILVDARSEREYADGHVHGAISLPLASVLGAAGDQSLRNVFGAAGITADARCVFYDDAYGAVASRAAMALESVGGNAGLLDVTYSVWKQSYVSSSEPRSLESAEFAADEPPSKILADIGDVGRAAAAAGCGHGEGAVVLDSRERLNYLSGHIPGAVNMPYHMFRDMESDKILRSPADLRRMFANRGLGADKPVKIITYCGSAGTLSGLAYYALRHAGFRDISMYANSFREWKECKDVEVQQDATYWDLSAE